jgi:flavin-dependent dehydrogenase
VHDVAVIGGGPAGCAAAITLARLGRSVTLLERNRGSRDGFCGEFLSPDGVGSLEALGALDDVLSANPALVSHWRVHGPSHELSGRLPGPALGITRAALDPKLREAARRQGVKVREGAHVQRVETDGRRFEVALSSGRRLGARHIVGATGRSARIPGLNAEGEQRPREYVAFKAHFRGPEAHREIRLFPLGGAYVGVGQVDGQRTNVCYLARRQEYEAAGGTPAGLLESASRTHPAWARCWSALEPVSERWLSTGGLFFRRRDVEPRPGVTLCGDAAGLVSPFLGEGMSMALEAGSLAGSLIHDRFDEPTELVHDYSRAWTTRFDRRMRLGERFQRLLLSKHADLAIGSLTLVPAVARLVVSRSRSGDLVKRGARALEERGRGGLGDSSRVAG